MSFRPTCSLCEVEFDKHIDHVVLIESDTRPSQPEDLKSACFVHSLKAEGMWPRWEDDHPSSSWSMVGHLSCAELVLGHGPVLWNVAEVLDSAFALSRSVSRLRQRWFQKLVEASIYKYELADRWREDDCLRVLSMLKRLPLEVSRQIIALCLPYIQISYGVLSYASSAKGVSSLMRQRNPMWAGPPLSHKQAEVANYQVSQNGPIWASFVPFQGKCYVNGISDTPIQGSFSVMLKPADRAGTTMYVAYDHLGVRRIVCATPESTNISKIQEEPGLWWHTIPWRDDCTKIKAESDGVKIRSLYLEGERGHDKHYWPRPMPSSSYPRIIEIFTGPRPFPRIKRMKPLVLNGVGMRALSACFSNYCSNISAHYAGLPDLNYQDPQTNSNGTLWLHFILDKGEQISEIWNWENMIRGKGIVFRTNKGRIWTCSRQPLRDGSTSWSAFDPTRWNHLADLPPGEPTTIYLEESLVSITRLALHSEAPVQGVREPPLETVTFEEGPDNKKPGFFKDLDGAHCSSAPLTGLSTITPCWGKSLGHAREQEEGVWHITGLILRYEDGRARVLGQVRLDSLGEPFDVTACDGISLKYVWEKAMLERVEIGKVGGDGWMWMPWEGSMTWWFDNGATNKIFHESE